MKPIGVGEWQDWVSVFAFKALCCKNEIRSSRVASHGDVVHQPQFGEVL